MGRADRRDYLPDFDLVATVWRGVPLARAVKIASVVTLVNVLSWVLCLILRFIVAIIGIVTQTVPPTDKGGLVGYAPGYPAFDPLTWLFFVPAITMLFLAIWTIPFPPRSRFGLGRFNLVIFAWGQFLTCWLASVSYPGAPNVLNVAGYATPLFVVAGGLLILRMLAGAFHLVPAAWRVPVPKKRPKKKVVGNDDAQ